MTLLESLRGCSAAGTAVDMSTTTADERRLLDTAMVDSSDIANAAARSGGCRAVLPARLAFLYEASAARAAVGGSTTAVAERRLTDTATIDGGGSLIPPGATAAT